MERLRVNKQLIIYTLLIFLGGVFFTGAILTVQGYDVPWMMTPASVRAETNETGQASQEGIEPASLVTAADNPVVGSDIVERIAEQAGPAVVKLETVVKRTTSSNPFFDDPFFREFFGDSFRSLPQERVQQGLGSGFIISKDGYILTNNHVVEGADEIKVFLTSRQEPYIASVVGSDAELDLAVLKIDAGHDLPILKLGDSNKAKVGNWVVAIGNPYGLDHTVTVGVISAKGRPITIGNTQFKDLIQTDASINPGNSGGPLLNLNGEVVGINTAINAQAQGIGFAIPSSTVLQVLDQLLENGKVVRPWLGVYMQPVTKDLLDYLGLKKDEGALISAVQEGSPAEKAGLRRGDVVLEYNKEKITTMEDLQKLVQKAQVGDKAVLLVHRDKTTIYLTVTIGER